MAIKPLGTHTKEVQHYFLPDTLKYCGDCYGLDV